MKCTCTIPNYSDIAKQGRWFILFPVIFKKKKKNGNFLDVSLFLFLSFSICLTRLEKKFFFKLTFSLIFFFFLSFIFSLFCAYERKKKKRRNEEEEERAKDVYNVKKKRKKNWTGSLDWPNMPFWSMLLRAE